MVVNGGYAQVQSWSLMDILVCRGGQWWKCSDTVVNCGSAHVKLWPMMDILVCSGDQ